MEKKWIFEVSAKSLEEKNFDGDLMSRGD